MTAAALSVDGEHPVPAPRAGLLLSREELRELSRVSTFRGVASIAWTWGWIAAALALYVASPGVLTFAVGWVVVSGRHLALAILMHEGAHRLIARDKAWNDRITSWLTAYPIMLSVHAYRAIHIQHHKATWTKQDPDLALALPFPITKRSFARKVLRDLCGITGFERYRLIARLSAGLAPRGRGLGGAPLGRALRTFVSTQRGFLLVNGAMLATLTALGRPEAYVLLWVVPALTGYSLVLRLRSIAEHAVVSDPSDPLRQTRTTLAPWWLRFLMAPHHVNYHLEHHLYTFVPHYRLPRAHRLLREAGALAGAEIARSYWEVLVKATSKVADDGEPGTRGSLVPFS